MSEPVLLSGPPLSDGAERSASHVARLGRLPQGGAALIEALERSDLRGRGGASFPVGTKWRAVASRSRGDAAVLVNGAEGEPLSHKDRLLMERRPHLVLDGAHLAAQSTGARDVVAYIGEDHHRAAAAMRAALSERPDAERRITRIVDDAPARYVSGEECAAVNFVNDGIALPTSIPPRPFERGIGGRPTLVQNVETLAHLAMIARYGAAWFRGVGTPGEPGSMLCTVRDPDGRMRIVEAAIGTPLRHLVWLGDGVQAVLVGGYHSGWLSVAQARQLTLSNADLRPAGVIAGPGILVALPTAYCGLAETAAVARYLALESAGQCGPCFNGLPAIAAASAAVARPRPAERELANLRRWAGLVAGRGACHHPDGTVRFIASALVAFGAEIAEHGRGRCTGTQAGQFLPVPAAPLTESDWS